MSATPRYLLAPLLVLALLAGAVRDGVSAEIPSQGAYREWLQERARAEEKSESANDAAMAAALRQHLCAGDESCFPKAAWRALDERALRSGDPAILALAANVASYRAGQTNLAKRWSKIATIDRDNAYPLIMRAGAEWRAGQRAEAMATLKEAIARPDDYDYFAAAFRLFRPVIDAAPPSPDQLPPCTLESRDTVAPPSLAEARAWVLFEIVSDGAFPARLGDVNSICRDVPAAESQRLATCAAVGAHMARKAKSQLSRSLGLALQRSSAAPERRETIADQQRSELDELHRKLWWVEDAPDADRRAEANEFWLDQLSRVGEVAAADALIERFGEPPPEPREQRESRQAKQMEKAQACYARIRHDN